MFVCAYACVPVFCMFVYMYLGRVLLEGKVPGYPEGEVLEAGAYLAAAVCRTPWMYAPRCVCVYVCIYVCYTQADDAGT